MHKAFMHPVAALVFGPGLSAGALAGGTVGSTLPADFAAIEDASLGRPMIGFGAAGPVSRTPVILLHGNNDTPFPTACNPGYGHMQRLAQYLADNGYATSELWALGYQGDRCDITATDQTPRAHRAHQPGQRARPAPLRARRAGLHRGQAGRHRRPQPGRDTGARQLDLTGQGAYDPGLKTAHLGILNSPQTWAATLQFLTERRHDDD